MNLSELKESNIRIGEYAGSIEILIPPEEADIGSFLAGAFMLCWFLGWFVALIFVLTHATSSTNSDYFPYSLFGLLAWIALGFITARQIYRIFRKPIPETIRLILPNLELDTGISAYKIRGAPTYGKNQIFNPQTQRLKIEFNPQQIKTLTLVNNGSSNELTIHDGVQRVALGRTLSNQERKWLYEYLKHHYFLASASNNHIGGIQGISATHTDSKTRLELFQTAAKLFALILIVSAMCIHISSFFGVIPKLSINIVVFFGCFLLGLYGYYIETQNVRLIGRSYAATVFRELNLKRFGQVAFVFVYIIFGFLTFNSIGGTTKVENGKYFRKLDTTDGYLEISHREYLERKPHQFRGRTILPMGMGLYGFSILIFGNLQTKGAKQRGQSPLR